MCTLKEFYSPLCSHVNDQMANQPSLSLNPVAARGMRESMVRGGASAEPRIFL